jgi:Type IV secretory system Conjugative DNA transfer
VLLFDPTNPSSAAYNPLLEIRKGENEVRDAQNIADILVDPEGALERRNHWEKTSHSLLVGAILHVLYAEADKTLAGVANFLSDPSREIDATLNAMLATPHLGERVHPVVASAARELLNKSENERSGVLSTTMSFLGLYRDPVVAKVTGRSDWRIRELVDGDRPKGRIANEEVLVARRRLHGLSDDANVLHAVVTQRSQIEIFEGAEHLEQHDAAARWLVGRDPEIAIAARKRRIANDPICLKIGSAQKASMRPHVGIDRIRDLALIEHLRTAFRDRPEYCAVVAVCYPVAHTFGGSIGPAIEFSGRGRKANAFGVSDAPHYPFFGPERMDVGSNVPTIFGVGDGGAKQFGPRQFSVIAMRFGIGSE